MTNNRDSLPGRQIDEYRIEQLLGAGGMARVYRALDTRLQRYVALKVIAPDFRTDADYAERFTREAQSIGRLEHRNIVHIYRFGETNGLYYMAMEYIQGADLGWLINDYKSDGETMPLDNIARVMQDIGAALDYAHKRGVIHRDVKPGNIILDQSGRAVLTDFGLALLSDVGTRGEIFGSPHYISPEQAVSSSNVVPQSDQYSLGVTLFEMLTGEVPFPGEQPMEVAMRHVTDQPPTPSSINKAITLDIDRVVLKALEKEPSHRYTNNTEFAAAFKQAIGSAPVAEPPITPADTLRRPSMIAVPDKVVEHIAAEPLPPLPPAPPMSQTPAPSFVGESDTVRRNIEPTTPKPRRYSQPDYQVTPDSRRWLYPLMFAVGVFSTGLIVLLVILVASRGGTPNTAGNPTATSTTTITTLPAEPTAIFTATVVSVNPTITPFPTLIPATSTPVVIVPTNTPVPTLIPSITPTDIPLVVIATLTPSPVPPTTAPTSTSILIITPSIRTLLVQGDKGWIAFVNASDAVLSLNNFFLRQDDRWLGADAWNVTQLLPGECLRIYKDKPKEQPPHCQTIYDLPGDKKFRERWIEQRTDVILNDTSTAKLCYPAKKCEEGGKDKD